MSTAHLLLFKTGKADFITESLPNEHNIFAFPHLFPFYFCGFDSESYCFLNDEPCKFPRYCHGFSSNHSYWHGSDPSIFSVGLVCLSGDVVVKVSAYYVFVVELVDYFAGLFDGLYYEFYLLVQPVDLVYLYLEQLAFECLFASFRVELDLTFEFQQSEFGISIVLDPDAFLFKTAHFNLQLFVFVPQQEHLFC